MLADHDTAGIEGALEDVQRLAGLGIAAHEHVDRHVAILRPGMN